MPARVVRDLFNDPLAALPQEKAIIMYTNKVQYLCCMNPDTVVHLAYGLLEVPAMRPRVGRARRAEDRRAKAGAVRELRESVLGHREQ